MDLQEIEKKALLKYQLKGQKVMNTYIFTQIEKNKLNDEEIDELLDSINTDISILKQQSKQEYAENMQKELEELQAKKEEEAKQKELEEIQKKNNSNVQEIQEDSQHFQKYNSKDIKQGINEIINKKEYIKNQKEIDKIKKERIKKIFLEQLEEAYCKASCQNDIELLTVNLLKHKAKNIDFIVKSYNNRYDEILERNFIDYMDVNYLKFIQNVKKQYDYIFRIEEKQLQEEERKKKIQQQEEQQKTIEIQQRKQAIFNNTITALKTITFILTIPFILVIFFVYGICKNVK